MTAREDNRMLAAEDSQTEIPARETVGRASDWTIRADPEQVIRGGHQFVEHVDDGARPNVKRDRYRRRGPWNNHEPVGVDEVAKPKKHL